ncbi:MAG: MFS transporter [Deltaproteobacteria bacterium]|nr:MFS transporter [Deltaproteobacteria bacterium]
MFNFKGLPRSVFYLGLVSLFADISSEAIYPILPFFLTKTLGVSLVFIGLLEGVAEAISSLTKVFSGFYSDKFKNKFGFVFVGYFISMLRSTIGFATAPWQILAVRFSDRLGKGIRTAPRDAWLAQYTTEKTRGKIFGFHRGMDHFGATLAPLLATGFLFFFPEEYRMLFILTFIPGFLSLFFVMKAIKASRSEESRNEPIDEIKKQISFRDIKKLPRSFYYFLFVLMIFTLSNSADAFIILRLHDAGISEVWIPSLWAALNLIKMLSTFWAGGFSDKVGAKKAVLLGWAVYLACYICFAFSNHMYLILFSFLFYGVYFGLTEAPEKSLITALAPISLRGTAFGLYHLIVGLGTLPASAICGFLWQRFGASYGLGFAVLSTILSIILFLPFRVQEVKNV